MDAVYQGRSYTIRRKFLTVLGAKFHVYDDQERLILFSQQKAFKLREDIRVYADETKSTEMLTIQARQIVDFSAAYDVVDAHENTKVGALRRKGLTSLVRDSWELLSPDDRSIGSLREDSTAMALLRRFFSNLIPQRFQLEAGGQEMVRYRQRFNPFVLKLDVSLRRGAEDVVDPRLALAAGILLAAIEGRQQ